MSKSLRFSDGGSVDFDAEGFVAFFEQSEAEVDGEDEVADSADSMVFPCFDDEITLDAKQQKERKDMKRLIVKELQNMQASPKTQSLDPRKFKRCFAGRGYSRSLFASLQAKLQRVRRPAHSPWISFGNIRHMYTRPACLCHNDCSVRAGQACHNCLYVFCIESSAMLNVFCIESREQLY